MRRRPAPTGSARRGRTRRPPILRGSRRRPQRSRRHITRVVLHTDFLLAAADDGIYFAINDHLGGKAASFRTAFGSVVEDYAASVFDHCRAARGDASFVRIKPGVEPRCEFGLRLADDLLLIDSKRANLNSEMLMGAPSTRDRYAKDLVPGFEQLVATAEAIAREGIEVIAAGLAPRPGWRPSRVFGFIVTHRPIFLWFGSGARLAEYEDSLRRIADGGESPLRAGPAQLPPRALNTGRPSV